MLKIESDAGNVRIEMNGPVEEIMANLNMIMDKCTSNKEVNIC